MLVGSREGDKKSKVVWGDAVGYQRSWELAPV